MPIQGISNQIFELLFSPDKKVQNFVNSLKPGDILNGKIIDVFINENKAIINFKGYNLISQLPQNINIQKGDTINVIVYNINNKVYMKLNNLSINNNQTLSPSNNSLASIDILSTFNSLKIPVNEHNLFVAQNLIKYQLPINKENINEINNNLINFLQKKGVDYRIFDIQNPSVAREIILSNIIKFNASINEMNKIITQNQINDYPHLLKISEKLSNLINISIELNKLISGQKLNISEGSLYINFDNINKNNIDNITSLFERQNFNIIKNDWSFIKPNSTIQLNNNISLLFNNNSFSLKFENLINNLNQIVHFFNQSENYQIATNLNNIILNLNNASATKKITDNFNPGLNNIKNIFDEINKNVFQPNNIKLSDNVKQIFLLLNSFKSELQNIKLNNIINQNDFNKINNSLNRIIDIIYISNTEDKINPKEFINIQNSLKQFISDVNSILNFKIIDNNKLNFRMPSSTNIDKESIIESLVFLKSRNIDADNEKFIDIMSKYFINDMKLSNNIEKMNLIIKNISDILNTEKFPINDLKATFDIINNIKNILNDISLKPDNNNLKPEILLNQLKDFMNKSGINIENTIKNILLKSTNKSNETFLFTNHNLYNNLKSFLIKLSYEIDAILNSNINNNIKKSLKVLKEISGDILDNLNAIQLINHKQSAIDLIYTQIPIFLDMKYFNGELQVWYRKDGIKQDLGKLIPVNLLFILNTSNLGQIKMHLTIFKNQIDCIINTQNEKSKQILARGKNEFINKLNAMNYKINVFNIKLNEELSDINENQNNNQYIKLTNINLRA